MKQLFSTTALLMSCSAGLWAQTDSAKTDTVPIVDLNEIVVGVHKIPELKKNVAQQVVVLDAQTIANAHAPSSADLMANTGNVFVQKSQLGGGSITLRGFEANRTLLVIDGVRMNNLIYRAGHLQNIVTVDNNALERVEILYGSSSTIYGSDALGGAIHFYTRKPVFATDSTKSLKINALARYGSVNNESTGHIDVNFGNQKWASLTAVTYSNFGDLMGGKNQNPFYTSSYGERPYYVARINGVDSLVANSNRFRQVQSAYSQYDILQKIAFKQNETTLHQLNFQFSNSSDVPRYDRLTDPAGSGLKYAQWYYGPQTRMLAAYNLDIKPTQGFFQTIRAGANYQHIEESRHTRRFGSDNLQHRTEKVEVLGANLDLQKNTARHHIRLGLDAQYNILQSTAFAENIVSKATTSLDTRYPDGGNTMANVALYGSHTWKITERLTLTDGLRLGFVSLNSKFSDTSFFHFPFNKVRQNNFVYAGNIGLIHCPSDDLKLSVLVSTGFRAPNIDDLSKVFESAAGNLIVPNSKLKAEKTISTELGITKIFNQRTSWENVVYYTQFLDAIVTAPFQYNGQDSILYDGTLSQVFANQNQGRAYLYGFSSNFKSFITKHLLLTASVNYTVGRIKTDSTDIPLDHIPPLMARLQLSYTHQKFRADFFVNYQGAKKLQNYLLNGEDNEQYATPMGMPAWITANFRASYKIHKLLTLSAGVDNILDTQYRTFASGINGAGRNIFVSVRFSY